ncbi:MAG: metallophosphoesterase [Bacteroidetes bacterium]|nr:metallophosphoesterase [Bacteroidota bacterium]
MKRRVFIQTLLATAGGIGGALSLLADDSVKNSRPSPFRIEKFSPNQSVRFFILGDWGAGGKLQRQVAGAMLQKAQLEHPEFVVSVGDNFYPSGVKSADDNQFKTKFEDVYVGKELEIPWYVALGNHDYRWNPEGQVDYSMKNHRWIMPFRYFKFTKEIDSFAIEFFILDTDSMKQGKADEQLTWLEQELSQSKAHWKIVIGHHPIRSYGAHGEEKVMLQSVRPLLDKYGVQLYLCGHEHDLQCIKNPADKFTCIISGGGGGSRSTSYGDYTLFAACNGGFSYAVATKDKVYFEWLNPKSEVLFAHSVAHF